MTSGASVFMAMTQTLTRKTLIEGLEALGLVPGDTVLVRAAVKAMGPTEGRAANLLIESLLEVLGPDGTILGLAFTPAYPSWRRNPDYVWTPGVPSATGGLAAAMVGWPGSVRSRHPTNGFVAIGKHAEEILADHDHTTPCFHPMNKLLERNGKMILIGCVESSPGFSTIHLAQEHLGLSTQTIRPGLFGTYFEHEGKVEWFARLDEPGCSMGFSKFYADYVREGLLRTTTIGQAYSIGIDAKAAYALERAKLEKDATAALCDRPECFGCRGIWNYNKKDWPVYWAKEGARKLKGRFRAIKLR